MADNFTVLNSAGATVTFRSTDNGGGIQINQSIPTNKLGTAMIGQATMATSLPVVIASDQSTFTVVALEGGTWTVQAIEAGTWTVQAIEAGTWTVQSVQAGAPWSQNITQVGGVAVALGSTTSASSIPVVIASNQASLTATVSGTVNVGNQPTVTVGNSLLTAALTQVGNTAITMGQKLMATSIPVVIASDQSTLTTVIAAGAAAIGTVTAIEGGTWTVQSVQAGAPWSENITQVGGVAIALGSTTSASSFPVVIASNQASLTAVVSGTVNIGNTPAFNLAQVGATTYGLGQKVMATSMSVVIASDQSTIPVSASVSVGGFVPAGAYATATFTSASGTVSLPTGSQIIVYNAGTAVLSVRLGTAATITAIIGNDQIQAGGWLGLAVGTNTILAGITPGGAASAVISGGAGLPTGVAGLSSSGGGGAVSQGTIPWSDNISQWGGTATSMGQKLMATSVPVVIASDQSTLTAVVSGTVNVGNQATVTAVISGTPAFNLTQVAGVAVALGSTTSASSIPVVIASNQASLTAVVTGTVQAQQAGTWTVSGFIPGNAYATATFSATAGTLSLPAGQQVIVYNTGATTVSVKLGTSSAGTAIVGNDQIAPGAWLSLAVGTNTILSGITNGGTAPLVVSGGTGTPTGGIAGLLQVVNLTGTNPIGTVTALQGAAPWTQNITQVGGATVALGSTTSASSFPVVIASNQATLTTVIAAGTQAIGTVSAIQVGTWAVNHTQLLGQALLTAGVNGLQAIGGAAAASTAVSGYPLLGGGRSQTGEIAAVGDGNAAAIALDNVGKQIVILFANKENWTSGFKAIGGTTTATTIIAAVNATTKLYVTSAQFGNTSSSTILLTFNDGAASQFIVPTGGGSNLTFPVPLVFAANTAVLAACSLAVTTAYVTCQGYKGI